jgi:NADPH:quinone reductase
MSNVRAWVYLGYALGSLSNIPAQSKPETKLSSLVNKRKLIWLGLFNHTLAGARGGIGSAVAQLLKDKGLQTIYGTYRKVPEPHPPHITPIALSDDTSISTHLKSAGDLNSIDVLIDCAGYEAPLNDALKGMKPGSQVVVMAVHRPDGLFQIDLRTFYMKAMTLKGLKSSALNSIQVKELLDYLAAKFDDGIFVGPKSINQVALKDEAAVHQALKDVTTRSGDRTVIVV